VVEAWNHAKRGAIVKVGSKDLGYMLN
jgi:hypothetical protein